jgi:beta-N-acetylhexosaminidase
MEYLEPTRDETQEPITVADLSLEQQIGQLFMVGFPGPIPSESVIDLIQRHHVGGIVLFTRNLVDAHQVFDLTSRLQAVAREAGHPYPLLIATDQENGMVQRLGSAVTPFPGNMALGAIGDEHTVLEVAESTGQELKSLGINMNLAPDVDVNNNPTNPVIGVRSFGDDAPTVARLAAAAVQGYQRAGIVSCLKHFPGHGDTATDSHLGLPVLPFTRERLHSLEFLPFASGVRAGADTVMTAHVALPLLTSGDRTPATLSSSLIEELLRGYLNYQGVIISDCLEMEAIAGTVGTASGAVLALRAGIDLVLVSHTYALQESSILMVSEALHTGELTRAAIAQAAERVLRLKGRRLSWDSLPAMTGVTPGGTPQHWRLSERAYQESTTLVRDETGLVPLRLDASERILVLSQPPESVTLAVDLLFPHEYFATGIRERHANTHDLLLSGERAAAGRMLEEVEEELAQADLVIVATINAHLDPQQVVLMERILRLGKHVIGVAVGNPYDISAFPQLRTYLVTYEYTRPALAAAVRVLFGESSATGRLPVTIPGILPETGEG